MTNKQNVMAGKPKVGGAVFRAPLGTPVPTDAITPLSEEFIELGYVSSDGWARQINKAFEAINAWGGDEVSKSRTEHGVSFSTDLIENLNVDTQKAKWGEAAVTFTNADATHGNLITVEYSGDETDPGVWVFDMDDQNKIQRTVFFNCQDTTESFEQTFSDSDVVALPFEVTCYKDPVTGLYFIDYTDDGKKVMA
ncbi:MAG: hypothetical protein FWG47_04995 [Propionibacteriaceae bacterium]|nr:hypothetical protein [Propionibacteriaceae bacterium]